MVRFAEDDTYGGQDTYAGQEAAYGGQQETYGGQDWAQEGAYDEAAYTQPADEAGGAYGADAAYSQHVADDANDYGGQNTAASDDAVYDPAYAEEDYGDLDLDAGETRFPELEAAAASHLQACERAARRASDTRRRWRRDQKPRAPRRCKPACAAGTSGARTGTSCGRPTQKRRRRTRARPAVASREILCRTSTTRQRPIPERLEAASRRRRSRLPRSASPRSRSWTTPRRSSARGGRRLRSLNSER